MPPPNSDKLWHYRCKRRRLLFTGDDDEMFMTRSLNVTPKTTEQHLIVCSDKSVAYITDNKRLRSVFCTVEANYWQTRSIAWPLYDSRASSLVVWDDSGGDTFCRRWAVVKSMWKVAKLDVYKVTPYPHITHFTRSIHCTKRKNNVICHTEVRNCPTRKYVWQKYMLLQKAKIFDNDYKDVTASYNFVATGKH